MQQQKKLRTLLLQQQQHHQNQLQSSLNQQQQDNEFISQDDNIINTQLLYQKKDKPIFLQNINKQKQQSEDIQKCQKLFNTIHKNQEHLSKYLITILNWIKGQSQIQTQQNIQKGPCFSKGIQFYNCKNLIFLQYATLLQYYKLFKINLISFQKNQSSKGDQNQDQDHDQQQSKNNNQKNIYNNTGFQLYKKLLFYKSLILKLQPLEKKLDYQTNKLLKSVQEQKEEEEGRGKGLKNQSKKNIIVNQKYKYKNGSGNKHQNQHQELNNNNNKINQKKVYKQNVKKIVSETVNALSHKARLDNLFIQSHHGDIQNNHQNLNKNIVVKNAKKAIREKQSQRLQRENGQKSNQKYVPPKLSAVLPDQQKKNVRQQRNQIRRKTHLTRQLMDDLRFYQQGISSSNPKRNQRTFEQSIDQMNAAGFGSNSATRIPKRLLQKQKFQQQFWTRLPDTKQDRKLKKQLRKQLKRGNVNQLNQQMKEIKMMGQLASKSFKK